MPAFTRELERTPQRALSIVDGKGHGQAGLAHFALPWTVDIEVKGFCVPEAHLPQEAAAKVAAVTKLARDHQHPLDCVMEPTRGLSDALLFKKPRTVVASGAGHRQRA